MIIGCTKKLLDFLGIKPLKTAEEVDPLFSWTANLVTINRRKTLVAFISSAGFKMSTVCAFRFVTIEV